MAIPTNAYQRTSQTHALEDIRDIIYDVSPEEVPFLSNANTVTASNTKHEWVVDELDAASVSNAHIDGDDFAGEAITAPIRMNNECQIQRKDFVITRRTRKIAKAGPDDEVARQIVRKGRELKRDMESALLYNNAKVVDNGSVAPELAGLPTWIETSSATLRGATGADAAGVGTATAGAAAKTDGTHRALEEVDLLTATQEIYDNSQELPNVLLLPSTVKSKFSQYMFTSSARIATQYQDQARDPRGGVTVVGAVDVWVTDYAVLDVVPSRFIPANVNQVGTPTGTQYDAFIYNTDWCDCAYFDPISTDAIAKSGDSDKRMVLVDHTLVVRNWRTVSTVADIDDAEDMVAGP